MLGKCVQSGSTSCVLPPDIHLFFLFFLSNCHLVGSIYSLFFFFLPDVLLLAKLDFYTLSLRCRDDLTLLDISSDNAYTSTCINCMVSDLQGYETEKQKKGRNIFTLT